LCHIISDITHDRLSDIEKTYFVSAGFINGWNKEEIVHMTKAMVATGDKINFKGITLDKHCIGGVPGNRTSMIVIPIIAAAGFTIPKTSSRAITSPAGTADTMECLAKVELTEKKILQVIKKNKACIVHGGSINLAPADDKIIEVEHPLSIDAEGQLIASVMAKKYSVSSNHVLIDIPMGPQVKAKTKKQAKHLKKMFEYIGKHLGMNVKVIITDGTHPIGNGIGPLLEANDIMAVLKNDPLAPKDLREKSLQMAGTLLEMAGKKKGLKLATKLLEDCSAFKKMQEIIKTQGKQKPINLGEFKHQVKSGKTGKITSIDNEIIAKIARFSGCPQDKGSGLFIHKKINQKVKKGELLYTIYAENKFKLNLAKDLSKKNKGYVISSPKK
jgi:thymidine phosphorylase